MQNQAYVFIIFIINGLLIGILFDIFRVLRKCIKTSDKITNIEDILFGIISGLLVLFSIIKFNSGEIRVFLFIGILIGLIMYLLLFSNVFIKVSIGIVIIVKKIIYYMIIYPFKSLYRVVKKIIFHPIILVCIHTKSKIKNIKLYKVKNNLKFYKKNQKKKGFMLFL